jgi:hypothetical protein
LVTSAIIALLASLASASFIGGLSSKHTELPSSLQALPKLPMQQFGIIALLIIGS